MSAPALERATAEGGLEVVNGNTRREFLGGSVAAGALAILAGPSLAGPAGAATSGTRTIATAMGAVRVPANPQRVACVANYAMEDLFDLGMRPVGVPGELDGESLPRFAHAYSTSPKLGNFDAIDLERVAAVRPDLILGCDFELNTPLYGKLQQIAPTALFALNGTDDWWRLTGEFANAVNRNSAFDVLRQRYKTATSQVKSGHSSVASIKWAIVSAPKGEWVLWLPDSSAGQVFAASGAHFGKASAGKRGGYKEYSSEQLSILADVDAIALWAPEGNPNVKALQQTGLWKALRAVKSGHAYPMSQLFPLSYGQGTALAYELGAALGKLEGTA